MKRIVLCADDYGQGEGISAGILALLQNKRLSAVSCMVNGPNWFNDAQKLLPFSAQADVGLHFNLTEGPALSAEFKRRFGPSHMPLKVLIRRACLRQIEPDVIKAECHAQLDQFQSACKFLPRFVDGHQHVQHFPLVRDALLSVYRERLQANNTYLRLVHDMEWLDWFFNLKKAVIYLLGVKQFRLLLLQANIPHNPSFAGIYSFKNASQYPNFFLKFLKKITDGGLIMCHPGTLPLDKNDEISPARVQEFNYLNSPSFLEALAHMQVKLAHFDGQVI